MRCTDQWSQSRSQQRKRRSIQDFTFNQRERPKPPSEAYLGTASRNDSKAPSRMVRIGTCHRSLTLSKIRGRPRSRAKAWWIAHQRELPGAGYGAYIKHPRVLFDG